MFLSEQDFRESGTSPGILSTIEGENTASIVLPVF